MTELTITEQVIQVTESESGIALSVVESPVVVTTADDAVNLAITETTVQVVVQETAVVLAVVEQSVIVEITEGASPASVTAVAGDLADHEADVANPHGVTAVQAGADVAGSAAAVQANLDALTPGDIGAAVPLVDTKANILAADPAGYDFALATDTRRIYFSNGSSWYESPIEYTVQAAAPNMGAEQDESRAGYGLDYVTDKRLSHVLIGSNERDEEGAIRTVDGTLQIYLNGTWNDVVINFRFREDSSGAYELEHRPIGLDWWYEIMSGNSDVIGIDGRPVVQQYSSSMGAYQPDLQIDGGSF